MDKEVLPGTGSKTEPLKHSRKNLYTSNYLVTKAPTHTHTEAAGHYENRYTMRIATGVSHR